MKKIKDFLKRIFGGYDLNDLLVLAGGGLFAWGVWQIYPPASFILMGVGLVWWGLADSKMKARSKK